MIIKFLTATQTPNLVGDEECLPSLSKYDFKGIELIPYYVPLKPERIIICKYTGKT